MSATDTIAATEKLGLGFGFVFTPADSFWGLGIDYCIDAIGNYSPIALEFVSMFPGAAVDISQSGSGIQIIGLRQASEHSCKNADLGIEFNTEACYAPLTGNAAQGVVWIDWIPILHQLVLKHFQPNITAQVLERRDSPETEWDDPENPDSFYESIGEVGEND